jgi:hypothetical protein
VKDKRGESVVEAGIGKRKFGTRPLLEGDNHTGPRGFDFRDVQRVRVLFDALYISMRM